MLAILVAFGAVHAKWIIFSRPKVEYMIEPIKSDAVIFGMLMAILGTIFWSYNSQNIVLKKFYKFVPMLLLCYFLPSLLPALGLVDHSFLETKPADGGSSLYYVATRFLLPASLVLLTISIDLKEILRLGPKALVMFLTGTVGVILGGPLAVLIVSYIRPELVGGAGPESVWRGLSTVAGSWIGGGANQAAMQVIFEPSDKLYSVMVTIDVLVAEVWMLFLLLGVDRAKDIDRFLQADASSIETLQNKMEEFSKRTAKIATTTDLIVVLSIAFGITSLCHFLGDNIVPYVKQNFEWAGKFSLDSQFFWLIVLATTFGLVLSFTPLRKLEGVGASKIGTIFIFILVATIGLKMDVRAIYDHAGLFVVGGIWMLFHVALMFIVAWLIKAPYFFLAVGSKANIGGAASAPVVAAAFHPSLAPVGVLLAVLGYALGTYGAWLCALMMQMVAPS